jgi:RNase P subunit RPR2
MKKTKKQREEEKRNAFASVLALWKEALKIATKNPERARLYVKQIRAIKRHVKIDLPKEIKRGYCKSCYIPFTPETSEKKYEKGFIVVRCLKCNAVRRFKE